MNDHHSFRFGPFELHGEQRLLTRDGRNIALGAKTFALLCVLLEHAGKMLSNDELMRLVWPGRIVDEVNIRVHINRLRKVLDVDERGRSFIQTLSLRGYGFVGAVERIEALPAPAPEHRAAQPCPDRHLPMPLMPLVGRADDLAELLRLLTLKRMVALVGAGGVGKTQLLAQALRHLRQRVVYVDLAAFDADGDLLNNIASVCEGVASGPSAVQGLSRWLGERPTLLALDHGDCQIERVAICCAELLRTTPGLSIVAAGREPLRIQGEWVYRLAPLTLPAPGWQPTADDALAYSAPRLFVNLVSEQLGGYDLGDADATLVVDICRRLDGLPLAIELAAGMVAQLGLRSLSASLTDGISSLTRGHRGAPVRHRSLQASMDWSYDRLPIAERCLLLTLARFDEEFTQAGSGAHGELAEIIGQLVLKSWVAADTSGGVVRYRLLNTIRLYLRDRLRAELASPERMPEHFSGFDIKPPDADDGYPAIAPRRLSPASTMAALEPSCMLGGDGGEYA